MPIPLRLHDSLGVVRVSGLMGNVAPGETGQRVWLASGKGHLSYGMKSWFPGGDSYSP